MSLFQKSAGILISIDLKNSTELKFKNIQDSEKKDFYTQAFYQHHTKVYFQFIENLCRTNKNYIDQIFLIKNIGDEYWIIILVPENDNLFFKDLLQALSEVILPSDSFRLKERITLNYRIYAEYYPEILTFQSVWNLKYSEFIQKFFVKEELDAEELSSRLEKYSQTIGNFIFDRESPTKWKSTVRYDPSGTDIDLFSRCSGEAKDVGDFCLGENLFMLVESLIPKEKVVRVLLYGFKGFGNLKVPAYSVKVENSFREE
jgi:hypothetical protein